MATVCYKIFKHHKKSDGTYNVKIRIFHKGEKKYIDTPHYVGEKQLNRKLEIKDVIIQKLVNDTLYDYRKIVSELNDRLDLFSASTLRDFLINKNTEMNFLQFCKEHIDGLFNEGRDGSAKTLQTVRLSLIDFFKSNSIVPGAINERMLASYERYLRAPRKISRLNQFGKLLTRTVKGMGDAAVHNHMRDLRILFKAAMRFYNNPQIGDIRIPYCPFDTYKIVDTPETKKRNIKVEQIIKIRDLNTKNGSRTELAKDLFMLSFYLCGMNAVDLYNLTPGHIKSKRVEYNRSKTASRRKDNAFISIKITPEVEPLLQKYVGTLHLRYSCSENLDRAINEGMKTISKILAIHPITFYWARHSFGNIARNQCRLSKDDVALALNHIDNDHKVTDIYLDKDWNIVDDVQSKVIALLKSGN